MESKVTSGLCTKSLPQLTPGAKRNTIHDHRPNAQSARGRYRNNISAARKADWLRVDLKYLEQNMIPTLNGDISKTYRGVNVHHIKKSKTSVRFLSEPHQKKAVVSACTSTSTSPHPSTASHQHASFGRCLTHLILAVQLHSPR